MFFFYFPKGWRQEFDQRLDRELSRVRLAYAEAMQKDRDRRWGGGKLGVPLSGQLVYVGLFSFIQYLVGGLEHLDYFSIYWE